MPSLRSACRLVAGLAALSLLAAPATAEIENSCANAT
jgi:hypothetical protein